MTDDSVTANGQCNKTGVSGDLHIPTLSDHDQAILKRIFNPTLATTDIARLPRENADQQSSDEEMVETDCILKQRIMDLEAEGVKAVEENGDARKAIELFNQAIDLNDKRASSYNNRAQAKRLASDIEGAKTDLEKAIQLSGRKGKAACQAFTQRALINRFEGNDDLAREDFRMAADLGSEFSRLQLVAMNPYAAMCNAMMTEMLEKMRRGEI